MESIMFIPLSALCVLYAKHCYTTYVILELYLDVLRSVLAHLILHKQVRDVNTLSSDL